MEKKTEMQKMESLVKKLESRLKKVESDISALRRRNKMWEGNLVPKKR